MENLSLVIPDFQIEAFETKHALSKHHYSYLITWHGKKIFLSGDTEHPETISTIKDMDWAFMPAWLIKIAIMDQKMEIDSKMIAVYHIGTKDDISINGDKFVMLKTQGQIISIQY